MAKSFCVQQKNINAHSLKDYTNMYQFTTLYEANFLSAWHLVISVSLRTSAIHVQNKEVSYGKKITWLLANNEVFKHSRAFENVWV